MFENIASVDIGTSSIKVVAVKTGIKDFKVKNFICEDIDKENENREEALSTALSKIIAENDLKEYKILTNHPLQKTVIRNMTFPFSDKEKIAEAIPFEAEDNIPFKLEDIMLDFQMLKSKEPDSGEVLLAVAQKETVNQQLSVFNKFGISPVTMGLESQALFEFYRYFNKIGDETVIQLDIGNEKTILNIIHRNNLLFTRSIGIGMSLIYSAVSEGFKLPYKEAVYLFEDFKLDLTSFENNLQKDYQKENIKKNTIKGIYDKSLEIVYELIEQLNLTKMAFLSEYPDISFNRILISGGGSNITGIGSVISNELELPVISLPFLEEYTETKIKSQFPIAFGIILSYLNKNYSAISFLQGEFLPASSGSSIKQYYLAGFYIFSALVVLLINIIITSYYKSESKGQYAAILNERYKKYFHTRNISQDPVSDAIKVLKEEQKEFESIDSLIHSNEKLIDLLNDILSVFPKDESFELINFVLTENVIRLDGRIGSSIYIDEFKNKLTELKKFDDVTTKTSLKKGNQVQFTMNIKFKIPNKISEMEK